MKNEILLAEALAHIIFNQAKFETLQNLSLLNEYERHIIVHLMVSLMSQKISNQ